MSVLPLEKIDYSSLVKLRQSPQEKLKEVEAAYRQIGSLLPKLLNKNLLPRHYESILT